MVFTTYCRNCGAVAAPNARECAICGVAQPVWAPRPGESAPPPPGELLDDDPIIERLRAAAIGSYEIRGRIGRGGMAAVYLAHDLRLNRKVAIKVMLPELSGIRAMSARFKLEAQTAAGLSHPNIIIIHAVEEIGDLLFFVMQFVHGCSLDVLVREVGALPIPLVQSLLVQVARALHYAHTEGVVHRDVKPGNIMVNVKATRS